MADSFHSSEDPATFQASGTVQSVALVLLAIAIAFSLHRAFVYWRWQQRAATWQAEDDRAFVRSRRAKKVADELAGLRWPGRRALVPFQPDGLA